MLETLELAIRFIFAAYCVKLASTFLYSSEPSTTSATFICTFALVVLDLTYRHESVR